MEVGETLYRGSEESVVALFGGNTGSKSSGISTSDSGKDGWFSGMSGLYSGGFSSVMVGFSCFSSVSGGGNCGLCSAVSGLPKCGLLKDMPGSPEDGVSGLLGGGLSSNLGGFVCGCSEVAVD